MFGVASTAPTGVLSKLESETLNCGIGGGSNANFALRIASIFIIGFGSFFGAFLPLLAKRVSWLRIPGAFFDFVKYFGSGVIIATAFIHLLAPAIEALESECLTEAWHEYPYALVLCILSLFCIFILELMAFRWGNAKLAAVGAQRQYNSYRHSSDTAARTYVNHGSEEPRMLTGLLTPTSMENVDSNSEAAQEMSIVASMSRSVDEESGSTSAIGMTPPVKVHSPLTDSAWKRIIGIAVLEFGIVFHRQVESAFCYFYN
ncbi:low-affinity Zn(2+) transporter zrt2 [Stygiomarasmius scandens]|uniref:Low-affinity Zn(2+) transporter zrt2 n=1 Tax=Marasmiellus scandens TaxID=2682957 RepID=A0ABR1JAD1_9AGAR